MRTVEDLNNTESGSCIILGSGPSANLLDDVKADFPVIAVNGGAKKKKADYFISDDQGVFYADYFNELDKKTKVCLYRNKFEKYSLVKHVDKMKFPVYWFEHKEGYDIDLPYKHDDQDKLFPQARSSSITALYLAITLGFKEAYLLGLDCVYGSEKRYFWGLDYPTFRLKNPFFQRRFRRKLGDGHTDSDLLEIYDNFKMLHKNLLKHIKIYNASPVSKLDFFEKKHLV